MSARQASEPLSAMVHYEEWYRTVDTAGRDAAEEALPGYCATVGRSLPEHCAHVAAHAVRLWGQARYAWWVPALRRALTSSDGQMASVALRRACVRLGGDAPGVVTDIARWVGGRSDPALAGHVCRRWASMADVVGGDSMWVEYTAGGWWAVHGTHIIRAMRDRQADTSDRSAYRRAVTYTYRYGLASKAELARIAGVTRPTLDVWLSQA